MCQLTPCPPTLFLIQAFAPRGFLPACGMSSGVFSDAGQLFQGHPLHSLISSCDWRCWLYPILSPVDCLFCLCAKTALLEFLQLQSHLALRRTCLPFSLAPHPPAQPTYYCSWGNWSKAWFGLGSSCDSLSCAHPFLSCSAWHPTDLTSS